MKIGITGSLSSGKSTVAKMLSKNKNILFSADEAVRKLYSNKVFKKKVRKKFNLKGENLKKEIKIKLLKKEISFKTLGKLIHPRVRIRMKKFYNTNKNKKILFFEIPLLIESKLINFFDYIILVIAPKKIRLKRYIKNGGEKEMFKILDKNQIPAQKKIQFCDFIIVNNKSLKILKQRVNGIINQ